jgi:hypothetical protein
MQQHIVVADATITSSYLSSSPPPRLKPQSNLCRIIVVITADAKILSSMQPSIHRRIVFIIVINNYTKINIRGDIHRRIVIDTVIINTTINNRGGRRQWR